MDEDFLHKLGGRSANDTVVFSIGRNTFFENRPEGRFVRYVNAAGRAIEHRLGSINDLVEGDRFFDSTDEEWQDRYLPLLTAIESAINRTRESRPDLRDRVVMTVLDRLITKPDIRLEHELSNAIQDQMRLILSTNSYSMKEVLGCLRKVQKSVKRHHSVGGPTGYLDFIRGRI